MRALYILVRRELGSFFINWTGYVLIACATFLTGLAFANMIQALINEPITVSISEMFFDNITFWLVLLISTPIIAMRAFAQEKQSGTFETLMTAPVSDLAVVLAKFMAGLLFYCLMWLPLLGIIIGLHYYTNEPAALDPGGLAATFLGIILIGTLYVAMGCLASAITGNQMTAAMVTFVAGLSLFLIGYLAHAVPPQAGWPHMILSQFNMHQHMQDFSRGLLDSRAVVFYLTGMFLFLFLTLKAVESRRWK